MSWRDLNIDVAIVIPHINKFNCMLACILACQLACIDVTQFGQKGSRVAFLTLDTRVSKILALAGSGIQGRRVACEYSRSRTVIYVSSFEEWVCLLSLQKRKIMEIFLTYQRRANSTKHLIGLYCKILLL